MNPGDWIARAYGAAAPSHPGRWRLVSAMIRRFGLRRPESRDAVRRGVRFHFELDRFLDVHLYYAGVHDDAETHFLEANLHPGDVVFDVGANFGYYALHAARLVGPAGRVHAFEIARDEVARIERNLGLNPSLAPSIVVNRLAVLDAPGEVAITATQGAGTTHLEAHADAASERVPGVALDDYVRERGVARVDFLKCDIEGAELKMLRGARSMLATMRPLALLEINPAALAAFGDEPGAVVAELERAGYVLHRFVWTAAGRRIRRLLPADMPSGEDFVNVAAIPRERAPKEGGATPLRVPRPA